MARLLLSLAVLLTLILQPIAADLPPAHPTAGALPNELKMLQDLIDATTHNLQQQQLLKQQVEEYLSLLNQYMNDIDNKQLLIKLVKSAHQAFETIKALHLTQSFNPDFISELSLFSQVAVKRGIPTP